MKAQLGAQMFTAMTFSLLLLPAFGKPPKTVQPSGKQLFDQHCAKCHFAGANLVTPSKPIVGSKQLSSVIQFKKYLSAPPGHMPYYQNLTGDTKLVKALYDYCKTLKKPSKST